jgi:hypothetical protein
MTGPEHFREAEEILNHAQSLNLRNTDAREEVAVLATLALTHATLANAAATALNDNDPGGAGMPEQDYVEWRKVAGFRD